MNTDVQHPASTGALRIARRTLLIGGGAAAAGLIVPRPCVVRCANRRGSSSPRPEPTTARSTNDSRRPAGHRARPGAAQRQARAAQAEPGRADPPCAADDDAPGGDRGRGRGLSPLGRRGQRGRRPGHVRDTEMALVESGVQDALDASGLSFADLNYRKSAGSKTAAGPASCRASISRSTSSKPT